MNKKIYRLLFLTSILVAYQNCAETPSGQLNNILSRKDKVIGPAAPFHKIAHELSPNFPAPQNRTEVDIQSGELKIEQSGAVKSCSLDSVRQNQLQQLFSSAQICEPGPLPEGTVTCMAIGLPDILLSNASDGIWLQPLICNTGVALCDGKDANLRQILIDLRENPPPGCD